MTAQAEQTTRTTPDALPLPEIVEVEPASTGPTEPESRVVETRPVGRPAAETRPELVEAEVLPSQNDSRGAVVREALPRRSMDPGPVPADADRGRATGEPDAGHNRLPPAPAATSPPRSGRLTAPGPEGQAREPARRTRTIPLALIALIAVGLVAAAGGYVVASRSGAPAQRARSSAVAPVRVPPASSAPMRPRPIAAGQVRPRGGARSVQRSPGPTRAQATNRAAPSGTWRFPPVAAHPQEIILTVTNPNSVPVDVRIRIRRQGRSSMQHLRLAPGTGQEVGLDPHSGAGRLRVSATLPIRVLRLIITHGRVQLGYGTPVSSGHRSATGVGK
ncbi:MAG: hypothetical protein JOZ41_17470 [Chloroflexi bacterium]|nr:hypothetical protein [Chloroflexota bacterium]